MICRFLYGGAHSAPLGYDFPTHSHEDSWELVYYRSGRIRGTVGDCAYEISPGLMLLTPPSTPHAEIACTAYANNFLGVDAPPEMPWPRLCHDDADHTLGGLCRAMVRESATQRPDREEMLSLLMRQMDMFLRRARQQGVPPTQSGLYTPLKSSSKNITPSV